MAILTPTLENIINSFISNLQVTIPTLSTTPISVSREALINPAATQISGLYDSASTISVLQDIFQATSTNLDNLAQSYGLTRLPGTSATGILYVNLTQLQTRSSITINSGTVITSSGGVVGGTSFAVVGSYTFSSVDRAVFEATAAAVRTQLDSFGLQSMTLAGTVSVVASSAGSAGNVGPGVLNAASIPGVNNVINLTSTSGGTDAESDSSLRTRISTLFSGNSVGTANSLLAAALSTTGVLSGFSVLPGDPLMTRDGSQFDSNGNLIKAGTGRSVDIYVLGTSLTANAEQDTFLQPDTSNILSKDNTILIGQPTASGNFGFLPLFSVSSVVGEQSGATFTQAVPVQDSEGNILLEGNFALIQDVNAGKYSIIENLVTHERKLATFVNPSTAVYTVIDTFDPSNFANSAFSQDKIVFLTDEVAITAEPVTRGAFNGADQLRFSNVTNIDQVYEQITITDTILVQNFQDVPGGVAITLPHKPIVSVASIVNTRLATSYTVQIIDANAGTVQLIGRVPPRTGDYLVATYVWQKIYTEGLNYSLTGDLVDWIGFADQKGTVSPTLLAATPIAAENLLSLQPNVPSYLQFTTSTLSDREVVQANISGSTVNFNTGELALKTSTPYRFANTGLSSIGRIFKVTNTTKSFDYNLAGYQLQTNKYDPTIGVDTTLLPQQFQLSAQANQNLLVPGDKVILSLPSSTLALSTQSDFENNIGNNLAPVYDPTLIDFTPGGVILKTALNDTTSPVTSLAGIITQNLSLSGIVEVTDNLIISEGIVVDLQPATVVKIRPSSQLASQATFAENVTFDPTLLQSQVVGIPSVSYQEFLFIYMKPSNFPSSFFTIINDNGNTLSIRFDQDILTKTLDVNNNIIFYVNGVRVDSAFNTQIESTLDVTDINSSIKATLLGARTGILGVVHFISAYVASTNKFYVILERTPVITSNLLTDFTLTVAADQTISFQRFAYDSNINALVVEGDILAIDGYGDDTSATDYIIAYFINQSLRISIIVDGTLRVLGATPQTSVLFTSGGGSTSAAGDWEGIVFTPKSSTTNSNTVFQSNLNNARIRFANTGINIQSSDVNVQNCVIRDCLDVGISVSSTLTFRPLFTQTGFNLNSAAFSSATRPGFTTADGLKLARYPIPDTMVSALGQLPVLGQQLSNTSYVVNFQEGVDYKVYVDLQRAISIDTSVPPDGIPDHSLVPGVDYTIEYDIVAGYSLVFLYTQTSSKLRRVYDLLVDLQTINRPGSVAVDFFASIHNGVIFNNLIINTAVGISLSSLATLSVNGNTIDNNRVGMDVSNSIVSVRNNLFTGFTQAGITSDPVSLIQVQRNDIYSGAVVSADQTAVADTDVLLRSIDQLAITLFVRTPNKYQVGSVIKIDSEEMLVQGANPDSIIVSRAYNNTSFGSHTSGSTINLFQLNQFFTVTGINGDTCQIIETDSNGIPLPQGIPINMRQIAHNTFRAIFSVNRRADFYYYYSYSTSGNPVVRKTQTKVFLRSQPGVGVNDVFSVFHELPLNSVNFTPNMENFSADPQYNNVPAADYSYQPIESLASSQNPVYGSLSEPNPLHRYVGFLEVRITETLNNGQTRIPVFSPPLIVSSIEEEVNIVGVDPNNTGVTLIPSSFSTSVTVDEANGGAVGVFILDTPITLSQSGQYVIQYRRPADLGTSFPPYYIEGTITYVFEVGSPVQFDQLAFTKDPLGGVIQFTFNVANSVSLLSSAPTSLASSTSPMIISELGSNTGSVIQVNIKLQGNDSSYSPSLIYQFPILLDFALTYTPAQDVRAYKVLSLVRDSIKNITNIMIDAPISSDTYQVVGIEPVIEVIASKKVDNFDPAKQFLLALADGISIGDTFIVAHGDLTTQKLDSAPTDIIRVDYMSYQNQSEVLYFTAAGSQFTQKIYSQVDSIVNTLIRDGQIVLPSTEQIAVNNSNQPVSGNAYSVDYRFEAPIEGETLTVNYIYNDIIRKASANVEAKKSLFTDVQIRQATTVQVRIALSLAVTSGAAPLAVQTAVANAIVQLFNTFTDITVVRTLDASAIVRATGNIAGIDDIVVTTLSRNLITGEVVTVEFQKRESPTLEAGSPRINTSQNGKPIQIGSS